jgi:hypothetical protein
MAKTAQKEVDAPDQPTLADKIEVQKTVQPVVNLLSTERPCVVGSRTDGGLGVLFLIDPQTAHRIRMRAGTMTLDRYLWENILKQAAQSHVY